MFFKLERQSGSMGTAEGAKAKRREWAEHTWVRLPGEGQGQGEV